MKFEAIRATIEDAPFMGHIHSESWKKAYRGIIQDDRKCDIQKSYNYE
ncbi:hypothetical protein [Metaclostridioides mangenotii]|nr:hypothetical protein [Clostridioides mangenotii]